MAGEENFDRHHSKRNHALSTTVGGALVLIGICLSLSLMSWSRHDPSLNNASSLRPENWLGLVGAYVSDILLQTLGLGTVVLCALLIIWGVQLIRSSVFRGLATRIAVSLPVTFFIAGFLGTLPIAQAWALAPGLGFGGVLGDALSSLGLDLFQPILGVRLSYVVSGVLYLSVAVILTLFCIGRGSRWGHLPITPIKLKILKAHRGALAHGSMEAGQRSTLNKVDAAARWLGAPKFVVGLALMGGIYFLIGHYRQVTNASIIACDEAAVVSALKDLLLGQIEPAQAGSNKISSGRFLQVKNIVDEGGGVTRHHCSATVGLSDTAKELAAKSSSPVDSLAFMLLQRISPIAGIEFDSMRVRYDIVIASDEDSNSTTLIQIEKFDDAVAHYWRSLFADVTHSGQSGPN